MSNWNNFIKSNHLEKLSDHTLLSSIIDNNSLSTSNFFCDHYHYATLEVFGDSAVKFLHDLTTIDIKNLTNQCMFGAFCDPKGNVITNLWILKYKNKYLLRLPLNVLEIITNHLNKYRPLYKVSIEDVSNKWLSLGIYCENNNQILDLKLNTPKANEVLQSKDFLFINKTYPENVYEILTTDISYFNNIWEILNSSSLQFASNKSSKAFHLLKKFIEINPEISSKFTPNHLNYEKFDGISFNKGCYLGQEIIARIKYRTSLSANLQTLYLPINSSALSNNIKLFDKEHNILGTLLSYLGINPTETLAVIISKKKINPVEILFENT